MSVLRLTLHLLLGAGATEARLATIAAVTASAESFSLFLLLLAPVVAPDEYMARGDVHSICGGVWF